MFPQESDDKVRHLKMYADISPTDFVERIFEKKVRNASALTYAGHVTGMYFLLDDGTQLRLHAVRGHLEAEVFAPAEESE